MPDGQNILNAHNGGNFPEARIAIGGSIASNNLPEFAAGMRFDATVVKDLGNNLYEIELTVDVKGINENSSEQDAEKNESAEGNGEKQAPPAGRRVRLVVESKTELPVGGRVTFAVRAAGEQPVLEVVETSASTAQARSTQASNASTPVSPQTEQFQQSVVEVILPLTDSPSTSTPAVPSAPPAPTEPQSTLPPEAEMPPAPAQAQPAQPPQIPASLMEAFPPGSESVLTINSQNELFIWPSQETPVYPSPITEVVLSNQEAAQSDEAAPPPERVNIEADLIRMIQSTPPERRISLNIQNVEIRQAVLLQIALPAAEGGESEVVTIRGVIQLPFNRTPTENTQSIEAQPLTPAPHSQFVAGIHLPANVEESSSGQLLLRTRTETLGVSIPMQITIPPGTNVVAIPEEASLALSGNIQSSIPLLATTTGTDYKAQDHASLDRVVRELGILPNAQTRIAVESLTAENLPITRANINSLITSASTVLRSSGSEGYEPAPIMRAVAHQMAWDVPIIPELTRGTTGLLSLTENVSTLLQNASNSLAEALAAAGQSSEQIGSNLQTPVATAPEPVPQAENTALPEALPEGTGAENITPPAPIPQTYSPLPEAVIELLTELNARVAALPIPIADAPAAQALQSYIGNFASLEIQAELETLEGIITSTLESRPALGALDNLIETIRTVIARNEGQAAASVLPEGSPLPAAGTTPGLLELDSFIKTLFSRIVEAMPEFSTEERAALQEFLQQETTARTKEYSQALAARIRAENLPRIMQALAEEEESLLRNDPVLSRLSNAHNTLNTLGERAAAYKTMNIASSREEPGLFVAEVPLKFGSQSGESWLRVYYRKENKDQMRYKPWSSRVILDLNTTNMGPIVGDVRFFPTSLNVVMATADEDAVTALASEQDNLEAALKDKGFNPKLEFRALVIDSSEEKPGSKIAMLIPPKDADSDLPHLDIQA